MLFMHTFYQKLIYQSDPLADFCAQWCKQHHLTQGCANFGG